MTDRAIEYIKAEFREAVRLNTFNGELEIELALDDAAFQAIELLKKYIDFSGVKEGYKEILLNNFLNELENRT